MIAFYYGITGFACAIYYRRELLRSVKTFLLIGVGPTLGGAILLAIFFKSCYDLSKPENSESGDSWFGLGPPLVIGVGFLLLGVVLMLLWRARTRSSSAASPRSPIRRCSTGALDGGPLCSATTGLTARRRAAEASAGAPLGAPDVASRTARARLGARSPTWRRPARARRDADGRGVDTGAGVEASAELLDEAGGGARGLADSSTRR